jgi:hypothetical protein
MSAWLNFLMRLLLMCSLWMSPTPMLKLQQILYGFCNVGANGFHLYKSHLVFWWPHDMKVFRLYPLHGYTNLKLMLVAILFVSKFTWSYVRMNDLKRLTLSKPFFLWWNGWQCIMWLQWLFNMVSPSCIWMWNLCF